jgi:hypothetical protein
VLERAHHGCGSMNCLPRDLNGLRVMVCGPMLATGGSLLKAFDPGHRTRGLRDDDAVHPGLGAGPGLLRWPSRASKGGERTPLLVVPQAGRCTTPTASAYRRGEPPQPPPRISGVLPRGPVHTLRPRRSQSPNPPQASGAGDSSYSGACRELGACPLFVSSRSPCADHATSRPDARPLLPTGRLPGATPRVGRDEVAQHLGARPVVEQHHTAAVSGTHVCPPSKLRALADDEVQIPK